MCESTDKLEKLLNIGKSIASKLAVLIGITIVTAVGVMFLGLRESDGIKALADVRAQRSLIDAQRALIESYAVNQVDGDARIRVIEMKQTALHRDLLKDRFPEASGQLITALEEVLNAHLELETRTETAP